jgi:hypothetical protein
MAGLVPAIHVLVLQPSPKKDARDKRSMTSAFPQ